MSNHRINKTIRMPKAILSIIWIPILLLSCANPKKAIEKGHYLNAMNYASKGIRIGKDIAQNEHYLQEATKALVAETLEKYEQEKSPEVRNWKRSRSKLYTVLNQIGENNIKMEGRISESYDKLCEVKQELDLQIVNYYYDEGERLLQKSIATGETALAREAYREFLSSETEGAELFYGNLDNLKEECIRHGSIIIDSPRNVRLASVFLQRMNEENPVADCSVSYTAGWVDIDETSVKSVETITKEIKVGQNSVTDTSGLVTYTDIMEEIEGYKNITNITYTASQDLNFYVTANTDQCFLRNRAVTLVETEECTMIKYTGDKRVFITTIEQDCNSFFIKNDLERALTGQLGQNLFIN